MFDTNSKKIKNSANPEPSQLEQLLSFLDASSRSDLSGAETQDHLLTSLTLALKPGTIRN
ncbi:hypothetical protein N9L47_06430 [Rhodobacteraceae bacterium]|nr:hypothetical protein [Paracoccaceae bacterium]